MLEAEIGLVLNHSLTSIVVDEGENSKNDSELRDANASVSESIDDGPRITEPGNFGKDKPANQGGKGKIFVVALDQSVATSSITNQEC